MVILILSMVLCALCQQFHHFVYHVHQKSGTPVLWCLWGGDISQNTLRAHRYHIWGDRAVSPMCISLGIALAPPPEPFGSAGHRRTTLRYQRAAVCPISPFTLTKQMLFFPPLLVPHVWYLSYRAGSKLRRDYHLLKLPGGLIWCILSCLIKCSSWRPL